MKLPLAFMFSLTLAVSACDNRGTGPIGDAGADARGGQGGGGGQGGAGGGPAATTGPAKCRALVDVLCAKIVSCGAMIALEDCQSALRVQLRCDTITSVSATYDQCLKDIPVGPCPGTQPPATCLEVLDGG